jgi:uncharacterized RDD family membrane protein YckC
VCEVRRKEIYLKPTKLSARGARLAKCKNCLFELPEGAVYCPKCGTPVTKEEAVVTAPVQPVAEASPILAFWWERFIAWLIDIVIIGAFTWILSFLVSLSGASLDFTVTPGWPSWVSFFISFNLEGVFRFLYWTFMEGSSGQSFGKMVMRIKVVHLDGSDVNMGSSVVESVGKAFFLPLDLLIGWLLYPRKRQRIFNYISQTIVVKAA